MSDSLINTYSCSVKKSQFLVQAFIYSMGRWHLMVCVDMTKIMQFTTFVIRLKCHYLFLVAGLLPTTMWQTL